MDRISEKDIDGLGPRRRADGTLVDGFLWDGEQTGFGLKATPAGKKIFVLQYRIGGRTGTTQRITIGTYGAVTLTQARKEAKRLLGEVASGRDPAGVKKLHKQATKEKRAAGTLEEAIETFLAAHEKSTRYWHEKRQRLLSDDLKVLHGLPIRDVRKGSLKSAIDQVKLRSHSAARLLFADLRPLFKWALEMEIITANPMAGIKGPKPVDARERVLEEFEVKALWQAAGEMGFPFASIYKLLLLTGTRREEVAGMRWDELDLDAGVWLIPGERTKNGRPHRVALMPQALALLDRADVAAAKAGLGYPDSDLVFSTTGKTAPSGWSKAKKALDARMRAILGSKFREWRIHDLRRTCATGMEDLGIPTHIVETALNHVSGAKAGIVGIYQRAEHKEAVRAAFEAWARRVMGIVGNDDLPSNVVPLRKIG